MRTSLLMFLLCPTACFGVDRSVLDMLLARAATSQSNAYIEARARILALDTNALPLLFDVATDEKVDWRARLVARVVYERSVRVAEIEELRRTDWSKEPGYDMEWRQTVTGDSYKMGSIIIPKCHDAGLWHYYLEVNWKNTGELATSQERRDKRRFADAWPAYLSETLSGELESSWLSRVWADRLESASFTSRNDVGLYKALLRMKVADAVPTLVRRYEAYNKKKVIGPEMFPGENAQIFRNEFAPILDFADIRHAELLEAYIAEHPALAELKPRLAEVRARPAPPPVPDPPFRLGTNLVVRPSP